MEEDFDSESRVRLIPRHSSMSVISSHSSMNVISCHSSMNLIYSHLSSFKSWFKSHLSSCKSWFKADKRRKWIVADFFVLAVMYVWVKLSFDLQWVDTLYFIVGIMSSVGYGAPDKDKNGAPQEIDKWVWPRQLAIILLTLWSALFSMVFVKMLVDHLVDRYFEALPKKYKKWCAMGVIAASIFLGLIVSLLEGRSFPSALYLAVVSINTLGLVQKSFITVGGKLFGVVWLLFCPLLVARVQQYLISFTKDDIFYPTVSNEYKIQVERCRIKLRRFIMEKQCASAVLRLAGYLACKSNVEVNTRAECESFSRSEGHPYAARVTAMLLKPTKDEFPVMSYADFYQLAGVVAVEVTKGPLIPFHPGRKDTHHPQLECILLEIQRLDADDLRNAFHPRGFTDRDLLALYGGHTLGYRLGGPWTTNALIFDNSCFREENRGLIKLPSDQVLLEDERFKQIVEEYSDVKVFFRDYALAHSKLSKLGHVTVDNLTMDDQSEEYQHEALSCKHKLRVIIVEKRCAPLVLQLVGIKSWQQLSSEQPFWMIMHPDMLPGEVNSGIDIADRLLKPVKQEFPLLSYADFYQIAGYAAVEASGGPTIEFLLGRKDPQYSSQIPVAEIREAPVAEIPVADIMDLRAFNGDIKYIVALIGGHTLSWCLNKEHNKYEEHNKLMGPWTMDLIFDNSYFKRLVDAGETSEPLLPLDAMLWNDLVLRELVEKYATDQDAFLFDYAESHSKLSELGFA